MDDLVQKNMNKTDESKLPKWLQIAGALSGILVAIFGIYQWWYVQNNDDKCDERLSKAIEIVEEGRNCTNSLLKGSNKAVAASEIAVCYSLEKRGLNGLESIADNCKCTQDIRKSAIKEMILFYEGSMEPERFKSTIEELKSRLNNLN